MRELFLDRAIFGSFKPVPAVLGPRSDETFLIGLWRIHLHNLLNLIFQDGSDFILKQGQHGANECAGGRSFTLDGLAFPELDLEALILQLNFLGPTIRHEISQSLFRKEIPV